MTTNAIPLFGGIVAKNSCKALTPPADAPKPTTKKDFLAAGSGASARLDAFDFDADFVAPVADFDVVFFFITKLSAFVCYSAADFLSPSPFVSTACWRRLSLLRRS
jgi:hypothetical protein